MIRIINGSDKLDFFGALAVRIKSFLSSYGSEYSFAKFWMQVYGEEEKALVLMMDRCMTVVCKGSADDELMMFIAAQGADVVMSNVQLPLERGTVIPVYYKQTGGNGVPNSDTDYSNTYKMLSICFKMPEYSSWYVDICHRVRHHGAVLFCDDFSSACAAIHNGQALITGICVKPELRRTGLGRTALQKLISRSRCNEIYALCNQIENEKFYSSCGFAKHENVYEYIIGE